MTFIREEEEEEEDFIQTHRTTLHFQPMDSFIHPTWWAYWHYTAASLRPTHPMRETICSTMCLLKVMITNTFCVTKERKGESASGTWDHCWGGCRTRRWCASSFDPQFLNSQCTHPHIDAKAMKAVWFESSDEDATLSRGGHEIKRGLLVLTHHQHGTLVYEHITLDVWVRGSVCVLQESKEMCHYFRGGLEASSGPV